MNSQDIYLYTPEICNGHECPGDCDKCTPWADMILEAQADCEECKIELEDEK